MQVTRDGGFPAVEAPDGRTLYYQKTDLAPGKLWKSELDGSGETEVLDGVYIRGFVVTPDRMYLLLACGGACPRDIALLCYGNPDGVCNQCDH